MKKKQSHRVGVIASSLLLMSWVFASSAWALTFPKPDGAGRPDRRRGAGSRAPGENCILEAPKTLYVLAPENPENPMLVSRAITVSARPDLFWYVPPTAPGAFAEVRIETPQAGEVYHSTFALSGKEGIVQYRLPIGSVLADLQVGQTYRWTVRIFCSEEARFEENALVQVRSEVQRVASVNAEDDWSQQLMQATADYCTEPEMVAQKWFRLMEAAGLSYFGQAELLAASRMSDCR